MYSILIVEDDEFQRASLKKMIQSLNKRFNIYEASNALDAFNLAKDIEINLFLVDIELEESSGLHLANKLRTVSKYKFTWIIFLTTHIEFLTEAFTKVHCYDFILKPYNKNKVITMVQDIMEHDIKKDFIKLERKKVTFEVANKIYVKVYVDEIIFIEVSINSVIVYTLKRNYTLKRTTLKKLLSLIDEENIIQSHKSFAINLNYISKIEKLNSRLFKAYFRNCNDTALIGNKFKETILDKFNENKL
ncbi:response regulator transcription factor [Clostridium botulinum]|uniref:Stage 0 sporulation protein A homolog n=2 Tax=Clostridium botulinum TaxID=1491 RepID=C4IXE5_CLOBO|nr:MULTISPECIES: LytTR family DNA-binding domain-containing protein [Clostridium]ACT33601.1 two component transcriptional regulator, LytTR family [Clostridium botulinum D str. 1873]MBO3442542.1 response regulator transcription factor [Clostridium haemolyticum]NFV48132.1 response regulator transcription factor [Clostridium botulinum]QPW56681.1 response regulator transcription factor [Clostridium botulinum]BAH29495.1 putative two-component response regulator [Clostridium botulinum]